MMKPSPMRIGLARCVILGLCLLASLASVSAHAQEKVVKAVIIADLKNTDPIWTTAAITATHGWMIYDQLFSMDSDYQVHPQMVDTYTKSDDGLTWTFTLRPGLKFHDGDAVQASDAVASIRRWGSRDAMGIKLMEVVESLEADDDLTFTMKLTRPFGMVLEALGKSSSNIPFIMKEEVAANTDGFTQVTTNIGSGPFRMIEDEWVPGSKVVYEKFEDYVPREEPADLYSGGKRVNVDRVEWHYIPDAQTALSALIGGEVDYHEQPPLDLIELVTSDPNVEVKPVPLAFQGWIALNHLFPPFDDVRARRAMMYLINQKDYMQAVIGNSDYYMDFCGSLFVCDLAPYTFEDGSEGLRANDPEMAKKLFEEAGYDGEPLIMLDPTDNPILHAASLVTAQKMREIGINVEVQAMDWSTLTSRRAERKAPSEGGWHFWHTSWTHPNLLLPVSHPGLTGACEKAWFGWSCDEEMQELSSSWAFETDAAKREEIARKLQLRGFDQVPYGFYGQWGRPMAYRTSLKNVLVNPAPVFWNMTKE